MKKYLIFLFFISISCVKKEELHKVEKAYFKFDKVENYHFDLSEEKISIILEKEKISENENNLINFLVYNEPKTIEDKNFIKNLDKLNPKMNNVDSKNFGELNRIFSERKNIDEDIASCKPSYQNILVFKKSDTITGIAKICFDCKRFYIIGTKRNTESFGQLGDLEKLKQIIE